MTPEEHYRHAEALLAEGQAVVQEIRDADKDVDNGLMAALTVQNRRDVLGKQAMGIWAQAQVHATLATTSIKAVTYDVPRYLR